MQLQQFDPATDEQALEAFTDVLNAASVVDAPWQELRTPREVRGALIYGWDLEPEIPFLAVHDGAVVGVGEYGVSEYDNLHLAFVDLTVRPELRRQGYGVGIFEGLCGVVRGLGRTKVLGRGWDDEACRGFAARYDLPIGSVAVQRRQVLADIDPAEIDVLHKEATARAVDYELTRRIGRSEEDELGEIAVLTAAINDAPTDDLDVEDEVFSADRIRNFESAREGRQETLYRVLARHRGTGQLAGHTQVAVHIDHPTKGDQLDTAVAPAHRGHALGLLLKADMLRWLRDEQPQLTSIDTWNAESNSYMIRVNEALGYRPVGRSLHFQRDLT